jgi:predicted nucleic acid-binding protein
MNDRSFIDTNILVYAHDIDAAEKHQKARGLLTSLWDDRNGILSTQVLQEFYVTVTRKLLKPVTPLEARTVVRAYLPWAVETPPGTILEASEIEERNHISFWDAMIVAAAQRAAAVRIFTEDLNHGQKIEGIVIQNPFLA